MISASRSYQNNVEVMNTAKSLLQKTLQLGIAKEASDDHRNQSDRRSSRNSTERCSARPRRPPPRPRRIDRLDPTSHDVGTTNDGDPRRPRPVSDAARDAAQEPGPAQSARQRAGHQPDGADQTVRGSTQLNDAMAACLTQFQADRRRFRSRPPGAPRRQHPDARRGHRRAVRQGRLRPGAACRSRDGQHHGRQPETSWRISIWRRTSGGRGERSNGTARGRRVGLPPRASTPSCEGHRGHGADDARHR